jgi:hypothetical protein
MALAIITPCPPADVPVLIPTGIARLAGGILALKITGSTGERCRQRRPRSVARPVE